MRNTGYFKNKKIAIVGLARSGLACANLLYELGAEVFITDNQDNEYTNDNASRLISKKIHLELGRHTRGSVEGKDLVVISPGVPARALPVVWAAMSSIPVISEVEASWILCPATIIAVTGSSGKTTVTTLIGNTLGKSGGRVFICGNIGTPFSGEVSKMKEGDFVSLEISSFQLETIRQFKPRVAVVLNICRNHLDRYKDMPEYINAKKRIYMNQDENDFLVLNRKDIFLEDFAKDAKSKVVFFEEAKGLNQNQAAVLSVASALGIDKRFCLEVFNEFKGIEHRQEYVAKIKEVTFINDSKATIVESAVWAINNISSPIILIAGGRHKGIDYTEILAAAKGKVKQLVLIGEAREKIKAALEAHLAIDEADTLEEAVKKAFLKASPGDCVLLSPMCSSYDMFKDFEERGKAFKEAVLALEKNTFEQGKD